MPELPLVQNVFPGGADASTHTPSSAVLPGPACGGRSPTSGSLGHGRPGEGSRLSTCTQRADVHGSSEAAALLARTPAQATLPPRGTAAPEERASRPIDQPQRVLGILHLAVAGQRACGRSRAPQPSTRAHPALAVRVRRCTRPSRRSPCGGDHRGPAQTSRGCDSRRPPGLPEGEGGSGLPHASTGARTRGPVRGGAGPAGEADAPQPPPRAPAARQSSDALPPDARPTTDRSGGEGEARVRPGPRGTT